MVVLGPTASGKTQLACHTALQISGEIISADSRQIYRHMDIGTGKDLEEYEIDGKQIPYHLIDIREPGYRYNIAEYQLDFINAFNSIREKGHFPILCGGSGLYIETALRGHSFLGIPSDSENVVQLEALTDKELDAEFEGVLPELKEVLSADTRIRKIRAIEISNFLKQNPDWKPAVELPELQPLIIGVDIDRDLRREKITRRLKFRLENGLIEEVEFLLKNHLSAADLEYYGLEYKWVGLYLSGKINKETLFERLNIAIHQFAKRQMTWYRRMEKNGYDIRWIEAKEPPEQKVQAVLNLLNQKV